MKSLKLYFIIFFTFFSSIESKEIFMSTEGNDGTGDGSIDNPYLSIMKCQNEAESEDIVYIRGGTFIYTPSSHTEEVSLGVGSCILRQSLCNS